MCLKIIQAEAEVIAISCIYTYDDAFIRRIRKISGYDCNSTYKCKVHAKKKFDLHDVLDKKTKEVFFCFNITTPSFCLFYKLYSSIFMYLCNELLRF
jgi:hypothetical protein